MDRRSLVPDAVAGKQANRLLSPFGVGAATRGSAHGRPSGAHGVLRACCSWTRGSAYTHAGLPWKCNETFCTAMFKFQTPQLDDGRPAVFSPLPRPTRLECFARLPWVWVSPFGRGQRGKSHSAVKKVRNTAARRASSLLPHCAFRTRTTLKPEAQRRS